MLHLAHEGVLPGKPPFPLLHVDTTLEIPGDDHVSATRRAKRLGLELLVHTNQDGERARHQPVRPRRRYYPAS